MRFSTKRNRALNARSPRRHQTELRTPLACSKRGHLFSEDSVRRRVRRQPPRFPQLSTMNCADFMATAWAVYVELAHELDGNTLGPPTNTLDASWH